jgi:hypothetical protein
MLRLSLPNELLLDHFYEPWYQVFEWNIRRRYREDASFNILQFFLYIVR